MQFSVLMSVYKNENPRYLDLCLSSLKKQTLVSDEIVLVVDGAIPFALHDVINKWKFDLNIITFQLENNVGLGKALDFGLKKCNYDIIARMDTDDICDSTRFEKQIKFLQDNPQISMVGSATKEYNQSMSEIIGYRITPLDSLCIKKMAKKRNPFNHMTVVFRKNDIVSVGGYRHHPFMEDYNLWIRLISNGYELANLVEPLVHVRAGMSMINRRRGYTYLKSEIQLFKLKVRTGIDNYFSGGGVLLIRSFSRLIPISWLSCIYGFLRKK